MNTDSERMGGGNDRQGRGRVLTSSGQTEHLDLATPRTIKGEQEDYCPGGNITERNKGNTIRLKVVIASKRMGIIVGCWERKILELCKTYGMS